MRILFGPEHDGLHIDPSEPNGYEWWYFDAISDDERYVLVVIFFLGTPMSPYYKAVVDGKNPLPKDWCGVFVTLHERVGDSYKERAYSYNLYRSQTPLEDTTRERNYLRDKPLNIKLGQSTVNGTYSHNERRFNHSWNIDINERNLWFGSTQAKLTFTSTFLLDGQPTVESEDADHNWVCVAPDCRVVGDITFAGETISFSGCGYHDHNFGRLPWSDTREWFWGRVRFPEGAPLTGAVIYALNTNASRRNTEATKAFVATWTPSGNFRYTDSAEIARGYTLSDLPMMYDVVADAVSPQSITLQRSWHGFLQHAPFYKRFSLDGSFEEDNRFISTGVGEIFEPARLCGPIISRMMWTRIRRRS